MYVHDSDPKEGEVFSSEEETEERGKRGLTT